MKTKRPPKLNPLIHRKFADKCGVRTPVPIEIHAPQISRNCDDFWKRRGLSPSQYDAVHLSDSPIVIR